MSQKDYDLEPRWYVVHTYSGYENKVKTDLEKTIKNRELQDYFFDIIVPMEEQIEIKEGKRKTNLKKVFPGYVLVKMIVTEQTWYIVRNTRGVTGFVGSGTDPIALTESEIRKMGFDVQTQIALPLVYDDIKLDVGYRLDILVNELVIIELKSVEKITEVHHKQLITYLKLSGLKLGLLVNFNTNDILNFNYYIAKAL